MKAICEYCECEFELNDPSDTYCDTCAEGLGEYMRSPAYYGELDFELDDVE